jgi:large subunit ribosomal protein L6
MSRIGKLPIKVPSGVTVAIEGSQVAVNGAKGSLQQPLLSGISVKHEDDSVLVSRTDDEPTNRARHGLMRSLIQNMVTGVSEGFEKQLELNGVGYRVALAGADLRFNIGKSHELVYPIPAGITAKVEQNIITISGIDKQQVGQVAAEIRALKKPEPYKGKGIKYVGERIIRKSGKSGKEK